MRKQDLQTLLEEVGGLRHCLNLLDSAESKPKNMTLKIFVNADKYFWRFTPVYDGYSDWMNSIEIGHPWGTGRKSRRKYLRKLLAAEAKGREGLLDLLEKKNAALRHYLWEEVIEDQNP